MANIKRRKSDGSLLIGYRPVRGGPERYAICRSEKAFEAFRELERRCHREGRPVPGPSELVEQEATEGRRAEPVPTATLREFIGVPSLGEPGPLFAHARPMSTRHQVEYERSLAIYGAHIADLPMQSVRAEHVAEFVDKMLACEACKARASASGARLRPSQLAVTSDPFDGKCTDEHGASTHIPDLRRETVLRHLAHMRAAFNAGVRAGVCSKNPFSGHRVPQYEEPQGRGEGALSVAEIQQLADAMPPHLVATVPVSAYGLLRRSELFGLERGDIVWPSSSPGNPGSAHIELRRVYVAGTKGDFRLRPWMKTTKSKRGIELPPLVTKLLRSHMDSFRSARSPGTCPACAEEVGEWQSTGHNPHARCDFADDAPVFIDTSGARQNPNSFAQIFKRAAVAAGLGPDEKGFAVTHKVMRASGSTLLLELNVPPDVVKEIGGWSNTGTLMKHYFKLRDETRVAVAALMGQTVEATLGATATQGLPVHAQLKVMREQLEEARSEIGRLRDLVRASGGDPEAISVTPVRAGRFSRWDDERRVREAFAGASSQAQVLARLGLRPAKSNYQRMRAAAERLGLELPPPWGRKVA